MTGCALINQHHKDDFLDNAIYVITKSVINDLIEEFETTEGDASAFFEFTQFKQSRVFVSPRIYRDLTKNLLPLDETAYKQIDSIIEDGGLIIGDADFGSEYEDIIIMANKLRITCPNNKILIIKTKPEILITKTKRHGDVGIFDTGAIIEIIKTTDKEFRILYWGQNSLQ